VKENGPGQLPVAIWALGLTSLLMDMASELVHSLLPVYLLIVLRADISTIGWIEGVAESISQVTKVFSGALSDAIGRRKPVAVLGYGLAFLAKFGFPLATSAGWVAAAQSIDRFGKGIRGAPRDALVVELTPENRRGAAFGLRQTLDSLGSLAGPALALLLMWILHGNVRNVLWAAPIPALISVLALWWGVDEKSPTADAQPNRFQWPKLAQFQTGYWSLVLWGAIFTLARCSEAFLVLRAQDTGLPISWVPVVLIVMNIVYMAVAYPAGTAADEGHYAKLLLAGLAVLVVSHVTLALAGNYWISLLGAAFWGLHMALTQGTLNKLIADVAPAGLRATAFGVFNLVTGISTLLASVVAGYLWSSFGAPATFWTGAGFATAATAGLWMYSTGLRATRKSGS
jgi:MFS family permease